MRVILKVKKESAYAKYNGLTFNVKEFLNGLLALDINGKTVDFGFKEVLIVDFKNELNTAFTSVTKEYKEQEVNRFKRLNNYAEVNGIDNEVDILQ